MRIPIIKCPNDDLTPYFFSVQKVLVMHWGFWFHSFKDRQKMWCGFQRWFVYCSVALLEISPKSIFWWIFSQTFWKTEVAAAINTWIFGIENMKRAFRGRVDPDTWNHVERIGKESENFLLQLTSPYRPSDKDFPRIIYNNRWFDRGLAKWRGCF